MQAGRHACTDTPTPTHTHTYTYTHTHTHTYTHTYTHTHIHTRAHARARKHTHTQTHKHTHTHTRALFLSERFAPEKKSIDLIFFIIIIFTITIIGIIIIIIMLKAERCQHCVAGHGAFAVSSSGSGHTWPLWPSVAPAWPSFCGPRLTCCTPASRLAWRRPPGARRALPAYCPASTTSTAPRCLQPTSPTCRRWPPGRNGR